MKTSSWPIFILMAYVLINAFIVIPVAGLCFDWDFGFDNLIVVQLILAILMLIVQYLLFDIKVDQHEKRLSSKRKINSYIIMFSLLMGTLTFLLLLVLLFLSYGENSDGPLSFLPQNYIGVFFLIFFLFLWTMWSMLFFFYYKKTNRDSLINRTLSAAIAGSVLELLIAIPSHIIMRNRGDCCAPGFSFLAILLATTVLLFAFGPGIVFLYLQRMKQKKARNQGKDTDPIDQIH